MAGRVVLDLVPHLKPLLGGMDLGQEVDEIKEEKTFLTLFYKFRRSATEGLAGKW